MAQVRAYRIAEWRVVSLAASRPAMPPVPHDEQLRHEAGEDFSRRRDGGHCHVSARYRNTR